ncbi:hypothetical protein D3C84_694510 [compost metagenome]
MLLLLFSAECQDIGHYHFVVDCKTRPGNPGSCQLLHQYKVEEIVRSRATVLFWHRTSQKACFPSLEPQLAWHTSIVLPLLMKGCNLTLNEAPDRFAKLLMFAAEQTSLIHMLSPDSAAQ